MTDINMTRIASSCSCPEGGISAELRVETTHITERTYSNLFPISQEILRCSPLRKQDKKVNAQDVG